MPRSQNTITTAFSLQGVGLHSGELATVLVCPAPVNTGRYFVIDDQLIPAQWQAVASTLLSTELRHGDKTVRTVEHLLAALVGMGIDNARIEIDHGELPILDGSALPWVQAIATAGITAQSEIATDLKPIQVPISVYKGDSFVMAVPSDRLRFTYGIEFPAQAIAQQWFSWCPNLENLSAEFAQNIAPARTFTMVKEIEYLRSQGLIKGGSLENAIVCDDQKWLNPPLRFENEACRHKLLDLIGDLSLLGFLPQAHIIAFKASHHLHTQFAQALHNLI
ncbi:UDP-3-O-(3-hydroxymyristoyl) N-acetylglucosamine deacetylase [Synechococcus sp. PCC 7502]|uniref:UDP-3-O-acyl-N-acetylglucosamine deacetylase n=1 Tax=Synechococcus sp. PCC 7502 TaxID=1173263 RepID=UPI00029FBE0D|nr:UDP-3-O-acyl-N-acetylglucosamine deacetylase [Synechococcus sp. PCC 7502]AFY72184.1 UDP-3-O-(3-hydroxymyristoyl) N-acetylglucosamine deacetylase [Synechococcus sp. PCC 7502]